MTARRPAPLVPAELQALLGLLNQLASPLPLPADRNWDAWRTAEIRRDAVLQSRLDGLTDQLRICGEYPSVAAELLVGYCERAAAACRTALAQPLGYEPASAPGAEREETALAPDTEAAQ